MASTPNRKRYRSAHDPYNDMEEATTRPDFVSKQELSDAEKSAINTDNFDSQNPDKGNDSRLSLSDRLRSSERNQRSTNLSEQFQSTHRNSVVGKTGDTNGSGKNGKRGGLLKKAGPLSAIIGILFGGGAFFYASQSLLAPHLSSLYTKATDLQFTSYNLRNTRLMSYMIDGGNQVKISNFTKKYTLFTPYMQKRLKNNGIDVGHLNADGNFESGQAILGSKTVLKYGDEIIDANSFQTKFANDANFRDAYYNAKRGRIAGFFDDSADYYYKKKGATRDIFDSYKSTGDEATDTDNFHKTVSDRVTGTEGNINTVRHDYDEETGEDHIRENGEDIQTNKIDGATPETKARAMVNNIAGKVSTVGVPVCSALRIANLAAVAVSAYQIYQSIAYFLSMIESISKMMAGEGDASAVNETLNFMTQSTTSEVSYVENGKSVTKPVTGSMLESAGSKLVMGNTLTKQEQVEPYSLDNITKAATTIALSTGATNTVCSGVMAASAIVSLASTAIPGGRLATFVIGAVAQTIGGIVMTAAVAAIIEAIIPHVAKMFASDIFETYTGIPAGELFSEGAAAANFSLATQGSALMPSSEENIKTQNRNTTLALAQEAEIDRLNRSPFDATSPNTFLGSILSKFSYLSYSNSFASSFNTIAKVVGSSIIGLTPAASAADQELSYTSHYFMCTNMDSAVCDMYGYPIVGSDYSTIDIRPDDPTYIAVVQPNLDSKGQIKDNSELAKFINFCVNRESPWGVTDANILNALQTDLGIVANNMPIVNDIVDIVNAAEDTANQKWATGANCFNSSSNPRWDSEFKYYQRYIQDMRILYSMDDPEEKEENPVVAYQKRYDEANPIDTSFEGTLARISGMTKDDVAFLLEYVDYSQQLANYNPATRYHFAENKKTETKIDFSENHLSTINILNVSTEPIFIDKRSYAV